MAVRRFLQRGDQCPAVAVLHALLITGHFMQDGSPGVLDEFDENIEAGVVAFQRWVIAQRSVDGLVIDGEVATKTFGAMLLHLGVDFGSLPDGFWPQE